MDASDFIHVFVGDAHLESLLPNVDIEELRLDVNTAPDIGTNPVNESNDTIHEQTTILVGRWDNPQSRIVRFHETVEAKLYSGLRQSSKSEIRLSFVLKAILNDLDSTESVLGTGEVVIPTASGAQLQTIKLQSTTQSFTAQLNVSVSFPPELVKAANAIPPIHSFPAATDMIITRPTTATITDTVPNSMHTIPNSNSRPPLPRSRGLSPAATQKSLSRLTTPSTSPGPGYLSRHTTTPSTVTVSSQHTTPGIAVRERRPDTADRGLSKFDAYIAEKRKADNEVLTKATERERQAETKAKKIRDKAAENARIRAAALSERAAAIKESILRGDTGINNRSTISANTTVDSETNTLGTVSNALSFRTSVDTHQLERRREAEQVTLVKAMERDRLAEERRCKLRAEIAEKARKRTAEALEKAAAIKAVALQSAEEMYKLRVKLDEKDASRRKANAVLQRQSSSSASRPQSASANRSSMSRIPSSAVASTANRPGWSATSARVRRPLSASFAWGRGRGIGGKPNPVWGRPPSPVVTRGDRSGVTPSIMSNISQPEVPITGTEVEKEEATRIEDEHETEVSVMPMSIAPPPPLPCTPSTHVVSNDSYPTIDVQAPTATSFTTTATTILTRRPWSPPQNRPTILSSPAPLSSSSFFLSGRPSSPPSSSSNSQHIENKDFRHFAESRTSWGVITRLGSQTNRKELNDKIDIGGGGGEDPSSAVASSSPPVTKTTARSRSQPRLCSSPMLTGVSELKAKEACDKALRVLEKREEMVQRARARGIAAPQVPIRIPGTLSSAVETTIITAGGTIVQFPTPSAVETPSSTTPTPTVNHDHNRTMATPSSHETHQKGSASSAPAGLAWVIPTDDVRASNYRRHIMDERDQRLAEEDLRRSRQLEERLALADQRRRKARELVLEKAKRRTADATQRISAIKQASIQSDMACEHLRNVLDQREEVLKQVEQIALPRQRARARSADASYQIHELRETENLTRAIENIRSLDDATVVQRERELQTRLQRAEIRRLRLQAETLERVRLRGIQETQRIQSIKQAEELNQTTLDKVRDEIDRQDEYIRSLDSNSNTITLHRGNNNNSNNNNGSSSNNNSPSQATKRSSSVPSNRTKHVPTSHILSSPSHTQANQNKVRRKSIKATNTSSNGKRSNDVSIITDTTLSFDADGFMAGVSSYQPRNNNPRQNNGASQLSASRRTFTSQGQRVTQKQDPKQRTGKLSPKRAKTALLNVGVKAMSSASTGNDLKSTKTQQQLASMVMERIEALKQKITEVSPEEGENMLRAIRQLLPLTLSLSPSRGGKRKSPRCGKIKHASEATTKTNTLSSSSRDPRNNVMIAKNGKKSPRNRLPLSVQNSWNGPTDAELEAMFQEVENDSMVEENDDDDDDDEDENDDDHKERENVDHEGGEEGGENSIDTEVLVSQIGDILGVTAEYGSPLRTLATARLKGRTEKNVIDNGNSTNGNSPNGNGTKLDQPQGDVAYHPRTHVNRSPLVSNETTSKLSNSNPPHATFEGQSGGGKWWSQDYQMLEGEVNNIIASETSPVNHENRTTKNERGKSSPSPGGKKSPKKNLLTKTSPKGSSSKVTMHDQNDVMRSSVSSTLPTYVSSPRKKASPSKQAKASALATLSSEIPLVQHLTMVNNHRMGHIPYSRIEQSSTEKTNYPLDEPSPTRSTRPHGLTPPTRYRPYEGLEGSGSPTRSKSPYSPSPLSPSHSSMVNTSNNMDDSTDISRQIDDKMSDVGKAISSLQARIASYMNVPNPNHLESSLRHDALPLLTDGNQTNISELPTTHGRNFRDNLLSSSLKDTLNRLGVSYTHPLHSDDGDSEDEVTMEPSNLSYDAISSSFSLSDALQGIQQINTQLEVPLHNIPQRDEEKLSVYHQQQERNMKQASISGTSTPISLAPLVSLRSSSIDRNDLHHHDDIDYVLLSHLTGNEQIFRGQQSPANTSTYDDTNSFDFK